MGGLLEPFTIGCRAENREVIIKSGSKVERQSCFFLWINDRQFSFFTLYYQQLTFLIKVYAQLVVFFVFLLL